MEDKDLEGRAEKRKEKEQEPPVVPEGQEIALQRGTTCLNCGVAFDREKVFCPQCGLKAGEDKYLPSDTFISPVERAVRRVRILPLISLLLGILGPFFLGIGWILAIVFGLLSLSAIRKRGGLARDRRMALGGVILGFIWPLVIGSVILLVLHQRDIQKRITHNEDSATSDLRNIARTQRFVKSAFFFDRDNDGKSEYGNLADLAGGDFPYLCPQLVSGEKNGYLFRIDRVTEEGFRALAIPLTYGVTGRWTFSIDQSGILRGEDRKGKGIREGERRLPRISPQSVFAEFDDEIAGDLLQKAKREAKERNFVRARKILEEIRSHYFLSPAAREVDAVLNSITIYIAEDKSREGYREAEVFINEGKFLEALALLRLIEQNFPEVSLVPEIRAGIERAERGLAQRREGEARELFLQGQSLEVEGKYEEALRSYERIGQEFKSTSYFERAASLLGSVRKKIEEKKAATLFARLGDLQPEKDGAEILRIIGLLRADYGETNLVKGRPSILNALQSRARGQLSKNKGLEELGKKNYERALKSLKEALQADSGLRKELKIPLQISHLRVGDKYFQGGNYERALVHYEEYLGLEPAEIALNKDKYNEAYYQLGKLEYSRGNLKKARENLLRVQPAFPERPELYYLLGSIRAREKDYPGAIDYFNTALRLGGEDRSILYRRGLCRLAVAWQSEEELSKLLEEKDKSGLKRGRGFVDAVAAIISEAESKGIQLELQAKPRILPGHKELTPAQIKDRELVPIKRERHLAKMRAETAKLESSLRQNESWQVEITAKLERTYESMTRGRNDLVRAAALGREDGYLREIIVPLRRKEQLFNQGKSKLELGLSQEIRFVESKSFSALELSLRAFERRRSLSSTMREIRGVYDSLAMSQMEDNLQEGRELLREAKAIEIRAEEHLSPKMIP